MKNIILILGLTFLSLSGFSQENLVGKKAPRIDVDKWVYPKIRVADWQNKTVPKDLSGKVIVIDFWFTKCAPCVASIPELNHLAKQFPEIVFLSVTFDTEKIIDEFLSKMVMYYPVGSDPTKKAIREFGVSSYPETFLIDKNGIIQWQGSPFQLNEQILNKALHRPIETKSVSLNDSELLSENSSYTFSIQKHNLGMGQSSYYHFNPFDINVFNKDLNNMLKVFYGINKSRILATDSVLLNTNFDLTLKADKEITTQANCVEMLKYLLLEKMGFKLKELSKDTIVGNIQIENDSLLNAHKSSALYLGTSIRYGNWESKGASLENLKDFLENNYSILLAATKSDGRKFDFVIPAKDIEKSIELLLKEYGLAIKFEKQKSTFWKIEKTKSINN